MIGGVGYGAAALSRVGLLLLLSLNMRRYVSPSRDEDILGLVVRARVI
jgi:hypothetical protein